MATSNKAINPFQSNQWNHFDRLNAESSSSAYLPNLYEHDMMMNEPVTFRSVSPKLYHTKHDYFEDLDEPDDDCDALYEATLLNSNFLNTTPEEKPNNKPLDRLLQLLGHVNPNAPLTQILETASVRTQFSSKQQRAVAVPNMVAFSMPAPSSASKKGKGIFKPTL